MIKRLFKRKQKERNKQNFEPPKDVSEVVELAGRTIQRKVKPVIGASILELAEHYKVDWNSNCRRGTCARCRCKVITGEDYLSKPNEAEIARLEPEEIEDGYRLGCQARVEQVGDVVIKHAPYF